MINKKSKVFSQKKRVIQKTLYAKVVKGVFALKRLPRELESKNNGNAPKKENRRGGLNFLLSITHFSFKLAVKFTK